jgi:hypothetical protein
VLASEPKFLTDEKNTGIQQQLFPRRALQSYLVANSAEFDPHPEMKILIAWLTTSKTFATFLNLQLPDSTSIGFSGRDLFLSFDSTF